LRAEVSEVTSLAPDIAVVAANEFLATLGDEDELGDGCCGQKFQQLVMEKFITVDPVTLTTLQGIMREMPTSSKQLFKGHAFISGLSVQENLNRMAALVLVVSAWKRGARPSEGNIVPHLSRRLDRSAEMPARRVGTPNPTREGGLSLRRDGPSAARAEASARPAPARRVGTPLVVAPLDLTQLSVFEKIIASDPLYKEAMRLVNTMRSEDFDQATSRLFLCGYASIQEHLMGPVRLLQKGSLNAIYEQYKSFIDGGRRQHLEDQLDAKQWFASESEVRRVSSVLVLAVASVMENKPGKHGAPSKERKVR
jgi:hypothetical protein